jgi:segregation and condensation protein B
MRPKMPNDKNETEQQEEAGSPVEVVNDEESTVDGEMASGVAEIEDAAPKGVMEPEAADDEAQAPAEVLEVGEENLRIESPEQAKAIVEAMLFASGEPVSAKRLANAMNLETAAELKDLISEIQEDCRNQHRGVQIVEVADGYQLSTRPECADWILRLLRHRRRNPLSPAALETLAIIAYKQPIIRAEVDSIRGVESSGVIRTLCDLGLVEVKGRKEIIGKPQLYGTTGEFLRVFGLLRLDDLPSIQNLRERYEIGQKP